MSVGKNLQVVNEKLFYLLVLILNSLFLFFQWKIINKKQKYNME